MSTIERRIKRLEAVAMAGKALPRYIVTAGPVSVVDRSVRVAVPEKKPAGLI